MRWEIWWEIKLSICGVVKIMTKEISTNQHMNFPGVVYRETEAGKVFYIRYRREGDRQLIEDRLTGRGGHRFQGLLGERNRRIEEAKG